MDDPAASGITDSQPEFYVPYLPVATSQRRFLKYLVPSVLWLLVGASVLAAYTQTSPGIGTWETGKARTFHGTIHAHPYPALITDDRGDGKPGMLLLVEVGKHGGGGRAASFDQASVDLRGWPLHRDGRWILELEPGEEAIQQTHASSPGPTLTTTPLGQVTLRGEIVDSKCFLGAMKPGEGKTHKECATLCISGGIPPMLVTRDAGGSPTFYLLLDEAGGPLGADAYPFIADAVELTGQLERQGETMCLRVHAKDIRRL